MAGIDLSQPKVAHLPVFCAYLGGVALSGLICIFIFTLDAPQERAIVDLLQPKDLILILLLGRYFLDVQ